MYVSIIGFVSPSDDKRNFVGCESWTKLSANKYDVLWNSESCRTLTSILNRYNAASGQCINRSKSAITFSSKTNMAAKIRVKEKLNISNEGGIEKYLGLPEHFARKKRDIFVEIVDRIRQRSHGWTAWYLSSTGKRVLLKAVLALMPTYAMLQAPKIFVQANSIGSHMLLV